jgi:hypothetical protein
MYKYAGYPNMNEKWKDNYAYLIVRGERVILEP